MSAERARARRLESVFAAASELPFAERARFLADACAGDDALRAEVEALLRSFDHACSRDLFPALDAPPSDELAVGVHLGVYTIVRRLATGGMGAVYLARRDDVALEVAIKLVRDGRLAAPQHVRRFLLERRVLARLQHPNVARLLDAGMTPEGVPFLVMEYVDGVPVDRFCDAGALGVEARLRLFLRVCEAVRYAHGRAVIHRDLKPSNILVTPDGAPKLLDFGVARLLEESAREGDTLTRPGEVLATPEYAAPEQLRGDAVTALSDVYSLGVLLHELLTGRRPPLPGAVHRPEAPSRLVKRPPRPRPGGGLGAAPAPPDAAALARARGTTPAQLRRRLRGALDAVVLRALEPEPSHRYSDVAALAADVQRCLQRQRPRARAAGWRLLRIGHSIPFAAGALALALAAGVVGVARFTGAPAPSPAGAAARLTTVAVLPFAVHGSAEYAYLRTGLPDLLSRGLDGAGELRAVDSRTVLRYAERAEAQAAGPAAARQVAARAGARLFVVGDVVEARGRLRIAAELYDAATDTSPLAHHEVEGEATELFRLVDRLTSQMLADRFRSPAQRLTRSAASATASLPALKAYLDGEHLLRLGEDERAVTAYQQAVALDSAFALAYYRMSFAATSTGQTEVMHAAAAAASRHGHRLAERDRLRVDAWATRLRGEIEGAELLYRRLLERYPEDVDGRFHYADLLFHENPFRGRSIREAVPGLQRVLAVDSARREASDHLLRALVLAGERATVDALLRHYRSANRGDFPLQFAELLHAARWGERAELQRRIAAERASSDVNLLVRTWWVGSYSKHFDATRQLAHLLAEPQRPPEIRAWAHLTLADLALAEGRRREASLHLARAAPLAPL